MTLFAGAFRGRVLLRALLVAAVCGGCHGGPARAPLARKRAFPRLATHEIGERWRDGAASKRAAARATKSRHPSILIANDTIVGSCHWDRRPDRRGVIAIIGPFDRGTGPTGNGGTWTGTFRRSGAASRVLLASRTRRRTMDGRCRGMPAECPTS
ncbi:MAG TPA: hypothetical protein VHE13_03595 [Opitutus sp.]|nr:hypothetical protein [Opitutus sp.]